MFWRRVGLLENVPRILPERLAAVLDRSTWPRPAIFDWLQRHGNVDDREMHRVFNCGIGMVVVLERSDAAPALEQRAQVRLQCAPPEVEGLVGLRGAVQQHAALVAAGDDAQAPVLDGGIKDWEPDGEDVGVVDFGEGDPLVLVPRDGGHHRVALGEVVAKHRLGGLDAHVLDRVGEDFAADQAFVLRPPSTASTCPVT